MRILMIAPEPFLEPRGTPISVYQRVKGLASLGHTIDLLTYHVGQDVCIPGVRINRIPRVPFVNEVRVGPSWYKPLLDVLLVWKAIGLLLTRRYDIIHSHEEAAFFSVFLAFAFRTRHIYDMHSSLPRHLANFNYGNFRPIVKLFELLERLAIRTADATITIGTDLEQHVNDVHPAAEQMMIENMPVQDTTGVVDQRSVDQLRERLTLEGRFTIVYTGTFERYQGLDLLLDSAKIVKGHHPNVSFLLVGGKPQQVDHWREAVHQRDLADCVHFVGTVPVDEVRAYMELGEILVSPRIEGLSVPLKIYSYLYSGKPIVATNIEAHTLVLDDTIAVLAAPTSDAFAAGIERLIQDHDLRQRLGRRSQQVAVEKYSAQAYLAKLAKIYEVVRSEGREMVEVA